MSFDQLLAGLRDGRLTERTARIWLTARLAEHDREVRAAAVRPPSQAITPGRPLRAAGDLSEREIEEMWAAVSPPRTAEEAERRQVAASRPLADLTDDEVYDRIFGHMTD